MSDESRRHERAVRDGDADGHRTPREESDGPRGVSLVGVSTERRGISGPTHTSTAVVVLVSVGLGTVLAAAVGQGLTALLGVGAAATYAVSLWLVDRDQWRLPAGTLAGALTLVVGAGLALAVGYTTLELVSSLFPVTEADQIRARTLEVVSVSLAATGATVAVLGGAASVGSLLRAETARAHADLAVKTLVVPLSAVALVLLSTVLTRGDAVLLAALLDPLAAAHGSLRHPAPGRIHLFTFSLLGVATAVAVSAALAALPVTELPTGRRRERAAAAVASARSWARRIAVVAAGLLAVSVVELALPQATLAAVLPGPLYGALAAVTGADALRLLALAVLGASLGLVAVVRGLQHWAQTDPRTLAAELTPFVAGLFVVALVVLTHGHVLEPTLAFVAERLPGAYETAFDQQSSVLVDVYGSGAVTLVLAAALVGVTALLSLSLALGTTVGSLPDGVVGPALASTGLFVAGAIGAGAGLDPTLVLAAIGASLVVWDVGEYGVRVGQEVGRDAHTRTPELVHLGATLAVGALAVFAARWVAEFATGTVLQSTETLPVAFAVVLVGLVLLVTALR